MNGQYRVHTRGYTLTCFYSPMKICLTFRTSSCTLQIQLSLHLLAHLLHTAPHQLLSPPWSRASVPDGGYAWAAVSRHIPKEEMIRAPRAANVNATDFFAWIFWGTPVVGCGGRPSNQSKSPTSISKASSCASITALRQSALLSLIFGPSLSSRYFFWSAMGLLRRN